MDKFIANDRTHKTNELMECLKQSANHLHLAMLLKCLSQSNRPLKCLAPSLWSSFQFSLGIVENRVEILFNHLYLHHIIENEVNSRRCTTPDLALDFSQCGKNPNLNSNPNSNPMADSDISSHCKNGKVERFTLRFQWNK